MGGGIEGLIVWQKAMDLACRVPAIAAQLPRADAYTIGDQMRRAVISIPANLAEGHGRHSRRDFSRFVAIAQGSVKELVTLLLLTERRRLAQPHEVSAALRLANEVGRMLTVLHRKLSVGR